MSCFGTIFLVFVSRIVVLIWYLADTPLFILAFKAGSCRATLHSLPGSGHCWAAFSYRGQPWCISLSSRGASRVMNGFFWGSPSYLIWSGMAVATITATASIEEDKQYNTKHYFSRATISDEINFAGRLTRSSGFSSISAVDFNRWWDQPHSPVQV